MQRGSKRSCFPKDDVTRFHLKNIEMNTSTAEISAWQPHQNPVPSDGRAAEKASVNARFISHLRTVKLTAVPCCFSENMEKKKEKQLAKQVPAAQKILKNIVFKAVFWLLIHVALLFKDKPLDVLNVGGFEDLSHETLEGDSVSHLPKT